LVPEARHEDPLQRVRSAFEFSETVLVRMVLLSFFADLGFDRVAVVDDWFEYIDEVPAVVADAVSEIGDRAGGITNCQAGNQFGMSLQERARGVLLGLACGDALGRPVEFKSADQIATEHGTVTEMLGNGSHRQPAGTITDDTEMALCIARSLADHRDFVPEDVADRFVEWYQSGPFDIGMMTADAIRQLNTGAPWNEAGQTVWEHRREGQNAGNGSVMRCAPYALVYHDDPDRLVSVSRDSSAITHYDPRCQYGCAVLNLTIATLLHDQSDPLQSALDRVAADAPDELVDALTGIIGDASETDLQTNGYVVTTLQTALYHALTAADTREAIIEAVNLGGDADTIGAITGAVAGAQHGPESLPDEWLDAIDEREELEKLAAQLIEVA
jgi:ADP-ribosyl-[dinitrogen reductase] hydrolase